VSVVLVYAAGISTHMPCRSIVTNSTASAPAPMIATRGLIAFRPRTTSTNRNGSAVMKYHGVVVACPMMALLMSAW